MLRIRPEQLREMIAHCQREAPNEACGFVSGRDYQATVVYPMTNIDPSPVSFLMDPQEQMRIFNEMDERGEELVAIYHSHPEGRPFPSQKDIDMAAYPEPVYLIFSLQNGVEVRAFRIEERKVTEVGILIEPVAS